VDFSILTIRSMVVGGLLAICGCAVQAPVAGLCVEYGMASWYRPSRSRAGTAEGQRAGPDTLTAAHPFLPFGTSVRVTDLATGRSVTVRIDDRGPFVSGRIIDLSVAAAQRLGIGQGGLARVRLLAMPGRSGPIPGGIVPASVTPCRPGGGASRAL